MKIASSNVSMASSRTYMEQYQRTESLRSWIGSQRPDFENRASRAGPANQLNAYILDLSKKTEMALKEKIRFELRQSLQAKPTDKANLVTGEELASEEDLKAQLVEKMVEILTGKKIKIRVPKLAANNTACSSGSASAPDSSAPAPAPKAGWGLEYDFHESYFESEATSFSAQGIIKTADGKEIDFSISLNMSRLFMQEQSIHIRAGDAVKTDPLVINFDGNAAQLTQTKFNFDLDSDGTQESISFTRPGAGFLALDLNQDGTINTGAELFGPASGNGFTELARYDEDKNGWIDENDSIYQKLRIWTKDADGTDRLFALGEKGIGAIYLGNVGTQFALKDSTNSSQGDVRSTGLFVKEDGTVGTVQQVDLSV